MPGWVNAPPAPVCGTCIPYGDHAARMLQLKSPIDPRSAGTVNRSTNDHGLAMVSEIRRATERWINRRTAHAPWGTSRATAAHREYRPCDPLAIAGTSCGASIALRAIGDVTLGCRPAPRQLSIRPWQRVIARRDVDVIATPSRIHASSFRIALPWPSGLHRAPDGEAGCIPCPVAE